MNLSPEKLEELIVRIEGMIGEMRELEQRVSFRSHVDRTCHTSAGNLLHYLALRRHDLRGLQNDLAELGLSSLGRCESWAMGNVHAVLRCLRALRGDDPTPGDGSSGGSDFLSFADGYRLIRENAERLLGAAPPSGVRIMVTMPENAAEDPAVVQNLIDAGMDVMRINCAHDGEATWSGMIENMRRVCSEMGRPPCVIYMDLAGPNPRTVYDEENLGECRLMPGDRFILARTGDAGQPPGSLGEEESRLPLFSCTHPEILEDLRVGERLLINDGKISSVVRDLGEGYAVLEVNRSGPRGKRLRSEKGMNLPDTDLALPSLTDRDLEVLPFVVENADVIGYSFVRSPEDVARLRTELDRLDAGDIGIVLKIETVSAFRELPRLLLQAMSARRVGVMIARGDMMVECGVERLAEIQEEILWFCEAAHVPAIWATEVLSSMVKKGMPGRGEISDAAMSARSECVMLNKGPHIVDGVRSLRDILQRMEAHQRKKRYLFRPLSVSEAFYESLEAE